MGIKTNKPVTCIGKTGYDEKNWVKNFIKGTDDLIDGGTKLGTKGG